MTEFLSKLFDKLEDEKEYVRKSLFCAGNEYEVTVTRTDKPEKKLVYTFHDGIQNDSDLYTQLMCLMLDMNIYYQCGDEDTFLKDMGYWNADVELGQRVYKELKKNIKDLKAFFTKKELSELMKETENF